MSGELFRRNGSSRNSSSRDLKAIRRRTSGDLDLQPFFVGKESLGYVVTLKEEFGFVKCVPFCRAHRCPATHARPKGSGCALGNAAQVFENFDEFGLVLIAVPVVPVAVSCREL